MHQPLCNGNQGTQLGNSVTDNIPTTSCPQPHSHGWARYRQASQQFLSSKTCEKDVRLARKMLDAVGHHWAVQKKTYDHPCTTERSACLQSLGGHVLVACLVPCLLVLPACRQWLAVGAHCRMTHPMSQLFTANNATHVAAVHSHVRSHALEDTSGSKEAACHPHNVHDPVLTNIRLHKSQVHQVTLPCGCNWKQNPPNNP